MPFNPVTGQWESDVAQPPPPAPAPYNPDPQDAIERVRLAQDLDASGLGTRDIKAVRAQVRPDKGINIGRRNLVKGSTMEAIRPYLAMLYKQVADTPLGDQPHQRALGIAARVGVGGYIEAQKAREASNAEAVKSAEELQKERRAYIGTRARELAQHRWKLDEERRAAGDMVDVPGVGPVPKTSGVAMRHFENTGVLPKPAPDPSVIAARDALTQQRLSAQENAAKDEQARLDSIEATANGIADFSIAPDRVPRDRNFRDIENRANQKLREKGSPYTLQQLQALKANADKFMANENGARFIALRTSIPTFADHMKDFEDFTATFDKAYKRLPWWQANVGIIAAAKGGLLGPDAAAAAASLESNRPIVAKELSMLLAYPYAPFKESDEKADQIISNFWSPGQQTKAIEAVKRIARSRIKNVMAQVAYAGGKDNPYLLPPSEVRAFDEVFPEKPTGKGAGKTLDEQYKNGGK